MLFNRQRLACLEVRGELYDEAVMLVVGGSKCCQSSADTQLPQSQHLPINCVESGF